MQIFIDEYDNFNFWEELAYQLADRDSKIELGDKFENVDAREFIKIHHKYSEVYTQEFIKNNLNNLKIK
jgi:hemerythrin superfamily protein